MATQRNASTQTNRDTIVEVFHGQAEAQQAIRELKAAGFNDSEIGVATHNKEGIRGDFEDTESEDNKAGTGAAIGTTAGLGAGALWGLGIVAGVLPAIGPVIAGGALAAVAASAAGTAIAGGVVGALLDLGTPEEEAEYYQSEFERGRTVVTVKATGDRYNEAHRIMDRYNSYDYSRRDSEFATNDHARERVDMDTKSVDADLKQEKIVVQEDAQSRTGSHRPR